MPEVLLYLALTLFTTDFASYTHRLQHLEKQQQQQQQQHGHVSVQLSGLSQVDTLLRPKTV